MDNLIQISKLNDFLYSPKSVYFHSVFEDFDPEIYHQHFQKRGKIVHQKIDSSTYSSAKKFIQGIPVYSEKYGLVGKIDIYNQDEKILIERKYKIQKIYLGYVYQVWAQYFCLQEMGYEIGEIYFHSLSDNKRYKQNLPTQKDIIEFEKLLEKIRSYDLIQESIYWEQTEVDEKTIYSSLYF